MNYCTSCNVCNRELKGNAFPIGHTKAARPPRANTALDGVIAPKQIERLSTEQALLIYPVGDLDQDPTELIGWQGYVATATGGTATEVRRGAANIALYGINKRDLLSKGRATQIKIVWGWHRDGYAASIATYVNDRTTPYRACLQAFVELIRVDAAEAQRVSRLCDRLLMGH